MTNGNRAAHFLPTSRHNPGRAPGHNASEIGCFRVAPVSLRNCCGPVAAGHLFAGKLGPAPSARGLLASGLHAEVDPKRAGRLEAHSPFISQK